MIEKHDKIIITGGTGFLGESIRKELKKNLMVFIMFIILYIKRVRKKIRKMVDIKQQTYKMIMSLKKMILITMKSI